MLVPAPLFILTIPFLITATRIIMIIIPLHQPISLCTRTAVDFLSVWVCCPCLLWVWNITLKFKLFLTWNEWYRKVLIKKTQTHKINLLLRTKSSKNFHLHTTGMNCKRHRSCIILDCTVYSTRLKTSYLFLWIAWNVWPGQTFWWAEQHPFSLFLGASANKKK